MPVETIKDGDIFASECDALVNPVNCVGYSGALAGVFAKRYPEMAKFYEDACDDGLMQLGLPLIWDSPDAELPDIVLLATMQVPDSPGDLDAITDALEELPELCAEWGIASIAIPALGCGVGGLDFDTIVAATEAAFADEDVLVKLFEPL